MDGLEGKGISEISQRETNELMYDLGYLYTESKAVEFIF